LNPSKWKEYELHAMGLGFLNHINPFKQYVERITHCDPLTQKTIDSFHKKTLLYVYRKKITNKEHELLAKNSFIQKQIWATTVVDTTKRLEIDKGNRSIITKGEKLLTFHKVQTEKELKEYYDLFKNSRRQEGLRTPTYAQYTKMFKEAHYAVFVAKKDGRIVAGIGTISNDYYMLQLNIAREKEISYASDYLTYQIINYCAKKGIRWFDLAGIHPNPEKNTKEYYIKRYKEKWKGDMFYQYTYLRK